MEQQAKERLTGGVILVVLLVLLVPELLTGPRSPPPQAPTQPDQAPMRSYTLDLGESVHANSAPVAASTTVAPAGDAVVHAPAVSAPVPVPAPAPAVVHPQPPAAVVAATTHESSPHKNSDRDTAGWTVQLGTFSSRENAAHLVANLKSHGFSSTIAEATRGGHKLYRVRVGAERDRAAAQKLLARLRAAGEKGGAVIAR